MEIGDLPKYEDIQWIHKLRLPDGRVTPGLWPPFFDEYGLSKVDFKGKRVLDIGCLEGQYSFYAERQGASDVLSIDVYSIPAIESQFRQRAYSQMEWSCFGYLYAHCAFGSKAKYIFPFSVYDLEPEAVGQFDVCLFLGVIYHLVHPALALEKINRVLRPGGTMILESEISRGNTMFCCLSRYNSRRARSNLNGHRPTAQVSRTLRSIWKKAKLLFADPKSPVSKQDLGTVFPGIYDSDEVFGGDSSNFWIMDRTVLERNIDFAGFRIEETLPRMSRLSYICTKVAETDSTYSAESKYSKLSDRVTNFRSMSVPGPRA